MPNSHSLSQFSIHYPNKLSEKEILALPLAGRIRSEGAGDAGLSENAFYFGDNFQVLQWLRQEFAGKVDLIYIDPPFGTGQAFAHSGQEMAYDDRLVDCQFLEFLRRRLFLMRELLSEQGSIYLHIDKKIGHYLRVIMDEVFGYQNHINDITRIKCNPKNFSRKAYGNYSDMILYYAKQRDRQIWHEIREPLTELEIESLFPKIDPKAGRYTTHPLHAPGETLDGDTGLPWKGMQPPKGRHWRYGRERLDELDDAGLVEWSDNGNPRKKAFAQNHPGKKVQDVWEFKDKGLSYVSYPTEKNPDLLARIIGHSSDPGSLVLDAFAGSGGTLVAAHRMGRRWIGIDQSARASAVIRQNLENAQIAARFYQWENDAESTG